MLFALVVCFAIVLGLVENFLARHCLEFQVKVPASPRIPLKSVELNGCSVDGGESAEEHPFSPPKKALVFDYENGQENGISTH